MCVRLSKAVARCAKLGKKGKRKRCIAKAVKQANRKCRAIRKPGQRASCLRSVKNVARRRS